MERVTKYVETWLKLFHMVNVNMELNSMNIIFIYTFNFMVSFTIAFLGVVILFSVDVWLGFTLATLGIILSLRTIGRV